MGYGKSTNTRVELLAIWALLFFSKEIGLPGIHIFGDSSVVIDWEKEISSLTILDLEAWCNNIKKLSASFSYVDYKHVYREYNEKTEILSKDGIIMASGLLSFTKFCEGIVIGEATIQLF